MAKLENRKLSVIRRGGGWGVWDKTNGRWVNGIEYATRGEATAIKNRIENASK